MSDSATTPDAHWENTVNEAKADDSTMIAADSKKEEGT